MKKIFLLFSIAVFLYLFTGCLEETSLFNADFPPFNNIPDKFQGFSGTYKVTFFGSEFTRGNIVSNAELLNTYNDYYVTNNCQKAKELFPDIINKNGKNQCDESTEINLLTDNAVIYVFNNQISLKIKIQAAKGIAYKYLTYKYQYITFAPSDDLKGNEIEEYYYDSVNNDISVTAYKHSDDNHMITKQDEKTVKIEVIYNGIHDYILCSCDEKTVKIEVIYNRKDINLDTPGDSINVKTKNTFILEKLDNNTIELINNNDYSF